MSQNHSIGHRLKVIKDGVVKARDVRRRKLRMVGLLATDRCNSRCKHCLIWNKKENHDLSLEAVEAMLADPVTKDTYFELSGGEFLDHPQWREIVELFSRSGRDYIVLSNGMYPDELIDAVREYKVPHIYMSLDGLGETYKRVRGIDAADNVVRIIDELKDETEVFVGYCITPWNSLEDLKAVKQLAEDRGITFIVGAYQNPEFFDTVKPGGQISDEYEPYLGEFMRLQNPWMQKKVQIPCWNIRTKAYIMGNGDVYLCQQKSVVLGNLYEKSLGEIWGSADTVATHEKYRDCNDCWLQCNRPFDAELAHAAKLMMPSALLNRLIGDFSWDEVHDSYRRGPGG